MAGWVWSSALPLKIKLNFGSTFLMQRVRRELAKCLTRAFSCQLARAMCCASCKFARATFRALSLVLLALCTHLLCGMRSRATYFLCSRAACSALSLYLFCMSSWASCSACALVLLTTYSARTLRSLLCICFPTLCSACASVWLRDKAGNRDCEKPIVMHPGKRRN